MTRRAVLRQILDAAIDSGRGDRLLQVHSDVVEDCWIYRHADQSIHVPLPEHNGVGRIVVVGAGKAAGALVVGLEGKLGSRIDRGAVIVKFGHGVATHRVRVLEAAHPVPDAAGAAATQVLLGLLADLTPHDLVFVLLTGGASALMVAPAPGLALADKLAVHRVLVRSAANIQEINVVRKHLSAVKGGQLPRYLGGATVVTLAISDVLGDDPATIASGPTVADPSTYADALAVLAKHDLVAQIPVPVLGHLRRGAAGNIAETPKPAQWPPQAYAPLIIASNRGALAAAANAGRRLELEVQVYPQPLDGDTHAAAQGFARWLRQRLATRATQQPLLLLGGGETTLTVRGDGRGGRCQEFALVAAEALRDLRRFTLLAAGTDGTDGPTAAAGAWVDDSSLTRAAARGLAPEGYLKRNDSYNFFEPLGDLLVTGPTGTNVLDLVAAIIQPES